MVGGQVFLEDAGFDWKILGPDVSDVEYVAWQSDQDAYACSGQKCSAQSILFMHRNWAQAGEGARASGSRLEGSVVRALSGGQLLWQDKVMECFHQRCRATGSLCWRRGSTPT